MQVNNISCSLFAATLAVVLLQLHMFHLQWTQQSFDPQKYVILEGLSSSQITYHLTQRSFETAMRAVKSQITLRKLLICMPRLSFSDFTGLRFSDKWKHMYIFILIKSHKIRWTGLLMHRNTQYIGAFHFVGSDITSLKECL